jgi:hypothetical protein
MPPPPALALRTAASACGRAQPKFSRAESTSWSTGKEHRGGWGVGPGAAGGRQLIAQFQHHAFGRLFADAGNAHQAIDFAAANIIDEIGS